MSHTLDSLLKENRIFTPSAAFSKQAHISSFEEYQKLFEKAQKNPEDFWAEQASQLHWFKKWHAVLKWDPPDAQWFIGGQINVSYNCLDRHLETRGNKTAILWEGEPGDVRSLTYEEV